MEVMFVFIATFKSNDKELLREMGNKVFAAADAELKNKIGRWFVGIDEVSIVEKEGVAAFNIKVDVDPSLHVMELIKNTLTQWWRHYAKIYDVYGDPS